ncbi:threonine/serine dehydratase [Amaricoccus sp.]|uniref:threonine ammonia-lyase n=1 Tax=Amaricoccus sp. TaxID=1872485 RepID=UPI001B77CF46|nr:pyridoxal-phosphate dependent enzyme [Amaricoccus sp.]MBP7243231.1 pyridoxal-phosphate dependent enzyme [Amaricoccus sp.]
MSDIYRIRAAAARARGHVRRTPLLSSAALDARAGRRIWVKAECLQVTGSFKARGAWAAVSALAPEVRARGVIAFSSGNHAQGVAWAAAAHGAPAVILMPQDAPAVKIEGTRALGAEVVLYDRLTQDRAALAVGIGGDRGLTLIPPYDHPEVIAGQGTTGLEIVADAAEAGIAAAEVLVCCGGGGLASGIALALEAEAPAFRVRTAEPAGFDDMARSLASGDRVSNPAATGSICDAILTPRPGAMTFPILRERAGPGLAVSDDEALAAMSLAFSHLHIVLEPGGAVALAAALFRGDELATGDVIAVASGGNVESALFAEAIARYPA